MALAGNDTSHYGTEYGTETIQERQHKVQIASNVLEKHKT